MRRRRVWAIGFDIAMGLGLRSHLVVRACRRTAASRVTRFRSFGGPREDFGVRLIVWH